MKKLILLIFMSISLFAVANEQEQKEERHHPRAEGKGFFMFGPTSTTVGALNDFTNPRGYGEFKRPVMLGGAGLVTFENGLVIGGEGMGFTFSSPKNASNNNFSSKLNAGAGYFDVGYRFFKVSTLSVYGLIGIGGGGYILDINEKSSPSFAEALDNPRRRVTLQNSFFSTCATLNADYIFASKKNENSTHGGGFLIGLRVGAYTDLFRDTWKQENAEAINGPDLAFKGFFAAITLGGGSVTF